MEMIVKLAELREVNIRRLFHTDSSKYNTRSLVNDLKSNGLKLDITFKKFLLYFTDEENKNLTDLDKFVKYLNKHKNSKD
jgi:hypothetical protein